MNLYMNDPKLEQGVGLLEVIIALALIMMSAIAVSNMLVVSIASTRASSVHFAIDNFSNEMLETLRAQSNDAQSGSFDFDGTDEAMSSILPEVSSWINRIANTIPGGAGSISCSSGFCDVEISWIENVDGGSHRQVYRTRTPL